MGAEVATLAKVLAPEKYGMLPMTASVDVERPPNDKDDPEMERGNDVVRFWIEEEATHAGTPSLIARMYPFVPALMEPSVLVPLKYGSAFAAPVYREEVAIESVGDEPSVDQMPPVERPRPKVGVEVATP